MIGCLPDGGMPSSFNTSGTEVNRMLDRGTSSIDLRDVKRKLRNSQSDQLVLIYEGATYGDQARRSEIDQDSDLGYMVNSDDGYQIEVIGFQDKVDTDGLEGIHVEVYDDIQMYDESWGELA